MSEHSIPASRWIAKKAARLGIASASLPLTAIAPFAARPRVLTYHRFADEPRSPFAVSPAVLERQMRWLSSRNLALTLDDVIGMAEGRIKPRHGVLVTMDDGDPTVFDNAAPIFERYAIPYVIYALPGRIGGRDHMTAAQLKSLAGRGAAIGSHTMAHMSVTSMSAVARAEDFSASKKALEDIIGEAVESFAYPFGTLRDFDQESADALRRAGYRIAFTSQHGPVNAKDDAMMVSRIKIEGGDPDWMFAAACRGAMDQWRFVDTALSRLQKPQTKDLSPVAEAA